jgi:predicted house-cleaning NTP pyrophosphatase (Maf/HAM1 superfamily)
VISDLNHKAFYGKILKKTKEIDIDDENLKHLSPRSREIATVMKIIKNGKISKYEIQYSF